MIDIASILASAFSSLASDKIKDAINKGMNFLLSRGAEKFLGYYLLGTWEGDFIDPKDPSFKQEGILTCWLDGPNWVSAIFRYKTVINGREVSRGADQLFRLDVDIPLTNKFKLKFERFLHTEISATPVVMTDHANYEFVAESSDVDGPKITFSTQLKGEKKRKIRGVFKKQVGTTS